MQAITYKDIHVGKVVKLGKFTTWQNKDISNCSATVKEKYSGSSGHFIKVAVDGHTCAAGSTGLYTVHLHNIKGILETN